MPAPDYSAVADGIMRLSQRTQAVFAQVADRHSLTPAHARLLCILASGPRGMTELAGMLGIEKAALTGLADRAEERGLLVRRPVAGDRRALSLALTPAGRSAAAAFHDDVSVELAELTCVLDPREREQFCRALARITATPPPRSLLLPSHDSPFPSHDP